MGANSLNGCGNAKDVSAWIFQAASLTKPVTAYAALELVLDGELDLDSTVAHYLPNGYTHFRSLLAHMPSDPATSSPQACCVESRCGNSSITRPACPTGYEAKCR